MNASTPTTRREFIGVVVGFLAWSVLWLAGTTILREIIFKDQIFPNEKTYVEHAGYLGSALALASLCSLVAGVVASKIGRSMRTVISCAVILLVVGIGVQISAWKMMPLWYHVTFLVDLVPLTILGGMMARAGKL